MLSVRRPVTPRRGRPRPGLAAVLATLADAALGRADDGLILDRGTRPADPNRLTRLLACPQLTVDLAMDHALREAAHLALCHGWRAGDLLGFAQPRVDELTLDYLADVLGLAAQWSAAAGWLAELDTLGRRQWWTSGDPHAAQWSQRHGVGRRRQVDIGVDVLALLSHLPRTVAAQPETPEASGAAPGVLVRESRIAAKIDALFARAVGTPFAHEAEACAVKAQELLLRYSQPVLGPVRRVTTASLPAGPGRPATATRRPSPLSLSA